MLFFANNKYYVVCITILNNSSYGIFVLPFGWQIPVTGGGLLISLPNDFVQQDSGCNGDVKGCYLAELRH